MDKKKNRWDFQRAVAVKALKDPTFKKQLLANPKEALKAVLKEQNMDPKSVDQYTNIQVHQEKPGELFLSIPYLPNDKKGTPVDCGGDSECVLSRDESDVNTVIACKSNVDCGCYESGSI